MLRTTIGAEHLGHLVGIGDDGDDVTSAETWPTRFARIPEGGDAGTDDDAADARGSAGAPGEAHANDDEIIVVVDGWWILDSAMKAANISHRFVEGLG